ncbi:DUF1236 domain-containing protein [Bradyrhizobium sp. SSUT18]|uniref:DUF1236 domain-containing protein n=1 Tax=unclassified Bradyrhizobium TaxID=2631580 RepID=UPI00244B4E06|nr:MULTISPECIES: DUF1236 domain-containing protein [unclassified Bradyrhizobium]MDH2343553.1 DUF1236 domain-containing protein [Bradyrhizobium sp. SSUT77]MDH2352346.1 DUF1236 domain-containing protein [Bradyrhizobium sp. SSUT112]MDH2405620.1 DUF1236 domain-containing protein [Bradyrhizobium sp. SSUT18]
MIRLLATTALGLVLANAAFAQSPSTNSKSEQTPQSQSNSAAPSTTSPSGAAQTQQTTSQPQQSSTPGASTQNTEATTPSSGSANSGSGTNATNSADTSSRPSSGAANSNTAGNQPGAQQSANPPAANSNQAQDRSNPPSTNANQAQQAPSGTGTNQAQQSPNAPSSNQAQGERARANSQAAARTDVNLNKQQETKISASISHLNVRPLTSVNFSLSVGTVVPRDIQLSTLPPDVVEIVPQYRGYSFALVKDEIVVVDPATYKIVTVLPYSGQSTATTTTTRERGASKFSDRDREVIRKHAKTRTEGRSERQTTGSTARSEIHVGDRVPDSVEVEEFPSTVYRDAPDLREYRYIHRDSRTYVIEPRERRIIEEID